MSCLKEFAIPTGSIDLGIYETKNSTDKINHALINR